MKNFLLLIFSLIGFVPFAQKKSITFEDYAIWKRLEHEQIAPNGAYVSYEINPYKGNGWLYLHKLNDDTKDSFPRGANPQFSKESNYLTFIIKPGFDTLRNCELNKIDKKKWPKDTLAIYLFEADSLIKIANYKSHQLQEDNNLLLYYADDNKLSNPPAEKKRNWFERRKLKKHPVKEDKIHKDARMLCVLNPITGEKQEFINVMKYDLASDGKFLALSISKNDSLNLHLINLSDKTNKSIDKGHFNIENLSFSKTADYLAYNCSIDTTKAKKFDLKIYSLVDKSIKEVNLPADSSYCFSEHQDLIFTDDKRFMYFGIKRKPKPELKDSLTEKEKVTLDLWHYKDKRLQPQQLKEAWRDKKPRELCILNLQTMESFHLGSDTLKISPLEDLKGDYLSAIANESYALEYQWTMSGLKDFYRISVRDGSKELVAKAISRGELSPSGNQFVWFNTEELNWYHKDLRTKEVRCLTCAAKNTIWHEDLNGMPMTPEPVGFLGWSSDETQLWISSNYDFWKYDLNKSTLKSLSADWGSTKKTSLKPKLFENDSIYIDYKNLYLLGFNELTKDASIFTINETEQLQELICEDVIFSNITKAKESDRLIFKKQNVSLYPDLYFTNTTWENTQLLSVTNPQQKDYNWAKVELIKWKSYEGIELEGLLYKPENFDPDQSYPLLVYYYELYNERLHGHYVPKPTASIIYPTEYASGGYVVFIPDVRYKEGHPAKSAFDCIMSGTDKVLDMYPNIDSTRMGLQGQSWGGYQTAQLITMTNRYRAAMAGAPVSNMFSAYGGIRWGSGINRQFQYEKAQSRIGKTIWEAPELYIENSPLFHLPKVRTPLLIMHNDADGAVPWYQGIELYNGLRRLGLPCWLLNYNDDDHNLMKEANRKDLSIRMRQFFDHYLMNQPAPLWLSDGIPAVDKGEELRYDLNKE